jgi:hypothetical protein
MEFIESKRGNQKLNIKLKKICGGQLSCSPWLGVRETFTLEVGIGEQTQVSGFRIVDRIQQP